MASDSLRIALTNMRLAVIARRLFGQSNANASGGGLRPTTLRYDETSAPGSNERTGYARPMAVGLCAVASSNSHARSASGGHRGITDHLRATVRTAGGRRPISFGAHRISGQGRISLQFFEICGMARRSVPGPSREVGDWGGRRQSRGRRIDASGGGEKCAGSRAGGKKNAGCG